MAITKVKSFQRQGPKVIDRLAIGWAGGITATQGYISRLLAAKKVAFDAPSVAAAAQTTTTQAVTGAALGDFCLVSCSVSSAALSMECYVSATDTVTIIISNNSAGAVDLAAADYNVLVLKASLTT